MKIPHDYKDWVVQELIDWAETFNNKYPDHMEEVIDQENAVYDSIQKLIEKFKNDTCSKKEYNNILFHLWQKNHAIVSLL